MPLDPAQVDSITQSINNASNVLSTTGASVKARKWAEQQYVKQRADNLADWNMQNTYNSPTETMKRLKAAGLNPHLVYGNGATTESAQVKGATPQGWQPKAPEMHIPNTIANSQDMQIKAATIDNLKRQNDVLVQDAILRASQVLGTNADTTGKNLKNTVDSQLSKTYVEASEAALQKLYGDIGEQNVRTRAADDANIRANELQPGNLTAQQQIITRTAVGIISDMLQQAKTKAEIESINATIQNIKTDGRLKKLDEQLREEGLNPTDPAWQRIIVQQVKKWFQ